MKTTLPLLIVMLLALPACKKHKAITPMTVQPKDSLNNTLPPLDPPKLDTFSRVDDLLGTYYGQKTRTVYSLFKPTNKKDTQTTVIDIRIEITKIDRNTFRYSQYDTGTLVRWKNFGRIPDDISIPSTQLVVYLST